MANPVYGSPILESNEIIDEKVEENESDSSSIVILKVEEDEEEEVKEPLPQ